MATKEFKLDFAPTQAQLAKKLIQLMEEAKKKADELKGNIIMPMYMPESTPNDLIKDLQVQANFLVESLYPKREVKMLVSKSNPSFLTQWPELVPKKLRKKREIAYVKVSKD